jgi:DNA polymerase-1
MLPSVTATDAEPRQRLVVVDGSNSLYRAFFAIPPLRAPDGTPTNAAYGFINMLSKVLRDERATAVIVVFDARGKTFRHELYPEYKAGREATPEDLAVQLPLVRELIEAQRIPVVELPEYEADDVIATLVARAPADAEVTIVSTDKDLMQLVDDRVHLLDGMKDRRYDAAAVEARFGVPPERMLDLRALVGDPSDNIPGVKGIGEKGAAVLIGEWGSLDTLLENIDAVKATRARNALREQADVARLSRDLATLHRDAPVPVDWADAARVEPDVEVLRALYERFGFVRLLDGLADGGAPARAASREVAVEVIDGLPGLTALSADLGKGAPVAIACVFGPAGPLGQDLLGVAFAADAAKARYVPVGPGGIALCDVVEHVGPVFAAPSGVPWHGRDSKRIQMLFAECGSELVLPCFDVELAAQLADYAAARSLSAIAASYLSQSVPSWEDLAGRGAKARAAADIPTPDLAAFAGREACAIHALHEPLAKRIDTDGLAPLLDEVELPMTRVLGRMERAGVRVDEAGLAGLAEEYGASLAVIEREIHELAGEEFLVSSPKQLQHILFEKLKLSPIKKTKTGYSTDESVLEQLAAEHALPARILDHRRLSKLLNTYVVALPPLVNERTGRVHPTFHQLGAATGRLSATNPNVQNIPIRSEEGVRLREMFVPAEGCLLLSADYSQVELRILAHCSRDEGLLAAFQRGDDIHRQTAAAVAEIAPGEVSADQRARAKAVNFGILYGLSAFGLANQLGIASAEAQATIDAYFERYPGVRRFLDESIAGARERGFVTTLLGRRRYLPDIGSRNRTLRTAAERMAMNSALQGTAADLIKKAMVELDAALVAEGFEARMILQVHDELVFDVPNSEVDRLTALARSRMENALALSVPLVVDVGVGKNWREAH